MGKSIPPWRAIYIDKTEEIFEGLKNCAASCGIDVSNFDGKYKDEAMGYLTEKVEEIIKGIQGGIIERALDAQRHGTI